MTSDHDLPVPPAAAQPRSSPARMRQYGSPTKAVTLSGHLTPTTVAAHMSAKG